MILHRLVLPTALVLVGALASGFFKLNPPKASIPNYGIFTFATQETIVNEKTVTGTESILDGIRWVQETTDIPAEVGTSFGIDYIIHGNPNRSIDVVEIITYPGSGLTNPETGKSVKVSRYPNSVYGNEAILMGYGLDTEWEAKTGEWIFQVEYEGQIVLEKRFHVR